MRFVYVRVGWECSAHDARILQETLHHPNSGFPMPPLGMLFFYIKVCSKTSDFHMWVLHRLIDFLVLLQGLFIYKVWNMLTWIWGSHMLGKYYTVDAAYTNMPGFMAPFRAARGTQHERVAKALFNRRHASVRNIIERSFGVLKKRFPILKGPMQN